MSRLTGAQVRFAAFGERFDLHLSILRDVVGADTRVRAVGAGGAVLADRKPRLSTYEGRLPHGGWVRAVVRSPEAIAVHFLHNVGCWIRRLSYVRCIPGGLM